MDLTVVAPVAGVAGSVEVDKGATNGPFLVGFKSYILRHNPYIIWRNQVNLWTTLWTVRSGIDNVSAICLAVCRLLSQRLITLSKVCQS